MRLKTKWNLRAVARVGGISAGVVLGTFTFAGAALADGPTITVQAPTTAQVATAPSTNTQVNLGGAAAASTGAPAASTVAAPVQASAAISPSGNVQANAASSTAPVNTAATVSAGATSSPDASARVGLAGAPAAASISVNTAPSGNVQIGAGNPSSSVTVSAPASSQAPAQPVTAQVNVAGSPLSASATAPTTVSAAAAPATNVQANVAGNTVGNETTAPTTSNAVSCPYVGVNVEGAACGSAGSATAVLFAPSQARGQTAPTTATHANIADNSIGNSTSAPAATTHTTCPMVGVNVTGYGCGRSGAATAVAYAPTGGAGSVMPSSNTHANVAGNTAHNTTSAPTTVSGATCPVAGLNVNGYSCARNGAATAIGFAPTTGRANTAPSSSTGAHVAGVNASHHASNPSGASLSACPLVGLGVTGYGCWADGLATGVLFTPASAGATTTPASDAAANTGSDNLATDTSSPAQGSLNTCPLIGIGIVGYGCSAPGSATGVIFAPTTGQAGVSPLSHTGGSLAGNAVGNTTSAPTGSAVTTCPLIGVDITGYGCGNPGSATGVIFAPTGGRLAADPSSVSQGTLLGAGVTNDTSAPTSALFNTCPLAGVDVSGYGCDTAGSALGVVFAPTGGQIGSVPSSGTQVNLPGGGSAGNNVGVPAGGTFNTCPVVGIAAGDYNCGTLNTGIGVTTPSGNGQTPAVPGPQGSVPGYGIGGAPVPSGNQLVPAIRINQAGHQATDTRFIPAVAGVPAGVYGPNAAPQGPGAITTAPSGNPPSSNPPAGVTPGKTVGHTPQARIPSVPPVTVSRRVPHTRVGIPAAPNRSAGGIVGSFSGQPSRANRSPVSGPIGSNAAGNVAGSNLAAGLLGMPRAGGANGFPIAPILPILPFLFALVLIGSGGLTRRFAFALR